MKRPILVYRHDRPTSPSGFACTTWVHFYEDLNCTTVKTTYLGSPQVDFSIHGGTRQEQFFAEEHARGNVNDDFLDGLHTPRAIDQMDVFNLLRNWLQQESDEPREGSVYYQPTQYGDADLIDGRVNIAKLADHLMEHLPRWSVPSLTRGQFEHLFPPLNTSETIEQLSTEHPTHWTELVEPPKEPPKFTTVGNVSVRPGAIVTFKHSHIHQGIELKGVRGVVDGTVKNIVVRVQFFPAGRPPIVVETNALNLIQWEGPAVIDMRDPPGATSFVRDTPDPSTVKLSFSFRLWLWYYGIRLKVVDKLQGGWIKTIKHYWAKARKRVVSAWQGQNPTKS